MIRAFIQDINGEIGERGNTYRRHLENPCKMISAPPFPGRLLGCCQRPRLEKKYATGSTVLTVPRLVMVISAKSGEPGS